MALAFMICQIHSTFLFRACKVLFHGLIVRNIILTMDPMSSIENVRYVKNHEWTLNCTIFTICLLYSKVVLRNIFGTVRLWIFPSMSATQNVSIGKLLCVFALRGCWPIYVWPRGSLLQAKSSTSQLHFPI